MRKKYHRLKKIFRVSLHKITMAAVFITTCLCSGTVPAEDFIPPIFDVHIHYSHDVWQALPPHKAIAKLRAGGISRAMVSSSGAGGALKLYRADPKMVIPSLRPYRKRGDLNTWMRDDSVIDFLKNQLAQFPYTVLGEFHLENTQADLPVVRRTVQLAKKHDLLLHVHSDAKALSRIFNQYKKARILWAHAGFEDAAVVRAMMQKHPRLWADLSFRLDIYHNKKFLPAWRSLLLDYKDRFMLGVDTYTPQRWLQIREVREQQNRLLRALPAETAEYIAYKNAHRVIAVPFDKRAH